MNEPMMTLRHDPNVRARRRFAVEARRPASQPSAPVVELEAETATIKIGSTPVVAR